MDLVIKFFLHCFCEYLSIRYTIQFILVLTLLHVFTSSGELRSLNATASHAYYHSKLDVVQHLLSKEQPGNYLIKDTHGKLTKFRDANKIRDNGRILQPIK